MYNHYKGNSGRVRRVDDAPKGPMKASTPPKAPSLPPQAKPSPPPHVAPAPSRRPPSPPSGLSGDVGRLLGKLSLRQLDSDDLLLLLILYLMYRSSHDDELLYIMAALLFL